MAVSVTLGRHLTLETILVEPFTGVDGEGAPSYSSSVSIKVRAVRQDRIMIASDGSKLRTDLTVWVPPAATTQPDERDRLTWESTKYIVMFTKDVKGRDAVLVHRRLKCRRE